MDLWWRCLSKLKTIWRCVCFCQSLSCVRPCNPMDCSPSGSSVQGILQARVLEWVAISFSSDLPNPGIKPKSPALQADSLSTEPQEKTKNMEWVAYPFSRESFWHRNWTEVSCIAGGFFTNGAIREAPTCGGVNPLNYNSPLHIGIYTAKNYLTSVNPQTRAQKKQKSRN